MFLKVTLLLTLSLFIVGDCGLLRTPKVYNALITTDENLTPSRAYPVVQPEISYPFNPFSPFGLYNSFGSYPGLFTSGQPQLQGRNGFFAPRNPDPLPQDRNLERLPEQRSNFAEQADIPDPNNSLAPQKTAELKPADAKSPIPLNEFGLPPSLLPISHSFGSNPQASSFSAYNPYNTFPVLYDSFNGYNPSQYPVLPPYGYYPQIAQPNPYYNPQPAPENLQRAVVADSSTAQNNIDNQINRNGREQAIEKKEQSIPELPQPEERPERPPQPTEPENTPDAIKNYTNKNKDIPDVPPPPVPSGAKSTQTDEQQN